MIFDNPNNKFAPYWRMAKAIIEQTHKKGECEPQDLLALGFTKQETIDLWHMANAMAAVEMGLVERMSMPEFNREARYA